MALPPLDIGGVRFLAHAAPELARYAEPVLDRCAAIQEHQGAEDGRKTIVDFSMYRLRQSGPSEFTVQGIDYGSDDLGEAFVDDLTTVLWIEASQTAVIEAAGVEAVAVDFGADVHMQNAALESLESGRSEPLFLERITSTEDSDSGWRLSVAGRPNRRGRRRSPVLAGLLVESAPHLIPFLQLPPGTVVELAGRRLTRVSWVNPNVLAARKVELVAEQPELLGQTGDGVHQLLDAAGNGRGSRVAAAAADHRGPQPPTVAPTAPPASPATPAPTPTAPRFLPVPTDDRVVVEHQGDGIRFTGRVAPQFEAYVRVVLDQFARMEVAALQAGQSLTLGFSIFWPERTGERSYRIVCPDMSDPAQFSRNRTDDLTLSSWADAAQYHVAKLTGLETERTFVLEEVAVQQAVIDALQSGAPVSMLAERIPLPEDKRYLQNGRRRSGWMITRTGEVAEERRQLSNMPAGSLVGLIPAVVPYLGLPDDTSMHLVGDRVIRAYLIDPHLVRQAAERNPQASFGDIVDSGEAARLILVGDTGD